MPIFEYTCADCGAAFEKIVPRHDSETECTHCQSRNIERQLSVFAVSGGSGEAMDPGCGRCGAPQPGMCQMK